MNSHMADDNHQRRIKIRISMWMLAFVTIAIYAGFMYLTVLAGAGGVE